MDNNKLKRCPFCGSKVFYLRGDKGIEIVHPEEGRCFLDNKKFDYYDTKQWNRRVKTKESAKPSHNSAYTKCPKCKSKDIMWWFNHDAYHCHKCNHEWSGTIA